MEGSEKMKKLFVMSAVAVFVLVLMSAGSAMAAEAATSDKFATSIEQSLKHYVMALEAYNSGNYGKVRGQLQAAASNAKHADPELAGHLKALSVNFDTSSTVQTETLAIGNIYNNYIVENGWACTQFDPGNPTAVPPGEDTIA